MTYDSIECPHCGAEAFPDLTRCPECGRSFYPLDEEEDEQDQPAPAAPWLASLAALFTGWLVVSGVAFAFHYLVWRGFAAQGLSLGGRVFLLAAGPVGSLAGGYVAAALVKRLPRLHALAVVLLGLGSVLVFETRWQPVTWEVVLSLPALLAGGLSALAGLGGVALYQRMQHRAQVPPEPFEVEYQLYQDLLAKAGYDRAVADRLVEYERKRSPYASQMALLKNAIRRWERDNR